MPPATNDAALLLKLEELTGGVDIEEADDTWVESLVVTSAEPLQIDDPDDDLKRELAFYNQALGAVRIAQQRFDRLGVPHVRPDDYFAEMVKSDNHMSKVKRRMLQEQVAYAAWRAAAPACVPGRLEPVLSYSRDGAGTRAREGHRGAQHARTRSAHAGVLPSDKPHR